MRFLSLDRPNSTLVRGSSSTISPMNQIEETNPMQTRQHPPTVGTNSSPRPVNRLSQNPPQSHTHVQQVASGQLVDRRDGVMALDRGTLAKIDRRVFAELGHASGTQAVKIPLSDAAWSTWRRYCQAIALTMGEGRRRPHRSRAAHARARAHRCRWSAVRRTAREGTRCSRVAARCPGARPFRDRGEVSRMDEATGRLGARAASTGATSPTGVEGGGRNQRGRQEDRPQRAMSLRLEAQVQALPWTDRSSNIDPARALRTRDSRAGRTPVAKRPQTREKNPCRPLSDTLSLCRDANASADTESVVSGSTRRMAMQPVGTTRRLCWFNTDMHPG